MKKKKKLWTWLTHFQFFQRALSWSQIQPTYEKKKFKVRKSGPKFNAR